MSKIKLKRVCKGFILIRRYPGSKAPGTFEPYTTGEFFKYPGVWLPVYQLEGFPERDLELDLNELRDNYITIDREILEVLMTKRPK